MPGVVRRAINLAMLSLVLTLLAFASTYGEGQPHSSQTLRPPLRFCEAVQLALLCRFDNIFSQPPALTYSVA